jgi:hypothetical protein
MGKMVGDQIVKQAAKPLKKGEKRKKKTEKRKKNRQFWNSRIAGSLSSVTPLSIQSCLCVS